MGNVDGGVRQMQLQQHDVAETARRRNVVQLR
jgi:hypothetical protein